MKNRLLLKLLVATFMVVGVGVNSVFAQKSLDRWVENVGKVEGVNYSVITKKNKVTKKVESHLVSIGFKKEGNEKLLAELISAANQDKKDAIEVIERKVTGTLNPQVLIFYEDETQQTVTYVFGTTGTSISLVVTKEVKDKKGDD